MPTVSIPEFYRPALDRIASMAEDDLTALRDALSRTGVTLKPANLVSRVRTHLKSPSTELDEVVQSLAALNGARLSADVSLEDFVRDVAKTITRRKDRPKDYDQSAFEQRLISLLSIESIALSARAADIQHDYERVFASARIVSDIRSVFGTSTVEPVGAMIVHNLQITYFEESRIREVFFALDNADVATLRRALDRADLKTAQLEQVISKAGLQYFESK